jgi:hypothetical protein
MQPSEQPQGAPATVDTFRLASLVSVAMLVSVLLYGGLGYFVVNLSEGKGRPPELPSLRILLYVVAIASQLGSGPAQRLGTCRRENLPTHLQAGRPGHHLLSRVVVRMALAEFPAVAGFVLYISLHQFQDFLILGCLSLALIVARWPSRDEWSRDEREAAVEVQR